MPLYYVGESKQFFGEITMSTDASIFEKIRDWPLAALFEINLLDQMLLECGVLHAATCGRYRNAIIDFIKSACRVMSYDFDSIPVRSFPWTAVKVRAYDKVWFVNPQKAGTAVMLKGDGAATKFLELLQLLKLREVPDLERAELISTLRVQMQLLRLG